MSMVDIVVFYCLKANKSLSFKANIIKLDTSNSYQRKL